MGYLKSTGTTLIYIGLFLAFLAYVPGIPPDAHFAEYSIASPKPGLTDDLHNTRLDNAEILFKGELKGPESFASYNGELYTTLHGGDVVKIVGKHVVPIARFGKPCDGFWMEKECGRPLGLQFDKSGTLYVADAYYGIFKVDVTSGKYERIIDISKPIEGVVPKLINSVDIASNGDVYWTDSSRNFNLQDGILVALTNPTGRLIKYEAATKKNVVLLDNLGFANGVKLSRDESFVVVVETMTSRLMKFNLEGDKKGRAEIFIEGLPGLPDNIHTDGKDGFLLSFALCSDAEHPDIIHTLAPHPNIRKMLVRLLYLLQAPFKLIEDVYPNYYSKRAAHWIGHFESIKSLQLERAGILRLDVSGKIIDSAYSLDGKIDSISSGFIFKDNIYLGSPYNEYMARVPLIRAFPSIKTEAGNIFGEKLVEKREVKEAAKPAVTDKPTTTPPPPTTTTTTKPRTVPTTPKPSAAPTQPPVTTPPPPTKPPQQKQQPQQQAAPKPSKPSKEAKPEPARQVPASPPPTPAPVKKVPVKEASPTQAAPKPVAQKQEAKPVQAANNAAKKPNNDQKPTKPVPAAGKNVKDNTEKKSKDEAVKPPVATKN